MGKKSGGSIVGQFIAYRVVMLESPAWQVLSLSARRCLNRIEIEHAHQGGNENGLLVVTYDDFVAYGLHRHAIGPALRELEALGFIAVTRGGGGNADQRAPNRYRLTYLGNRKAKGPAAHPTDEWARLDTVDATTRAAAGARRRERLGADVVPKSR